MMRPDGSAAPVERIDMATRSALQAVGHTGQGHNSRHLVSPFRPARQLRRIFGEQVSDATAALTAPSPKGDPIHLARKNIKRARATLRLLRGAIGEDAFVLADATLRAAAHAIGPLRDRDVLLQTIEKVIDWSEQSHERHRSNLLKTLSARDGTKSHAPAESIASAAASLDSAAAQANDWYIADSWYSLIDATKAIYRRAQKASRRTAEDRDEQALHALRRKTQCLRHALEAIALEPSRIIERLTLDLSVLSDLLGEDHDLAALEAALEPQARGHDAVDVQALLAVIDERRLSLQRRALKQARDIYECRPKRFAARLEKQWRQWETRLLH